jgi:uncharacterized membrane protein
MACKAQTGAGLPVRYNDPFVKDSASRDGQSLATPVALVAAALALAFAFGVPPFQVNDEHGHFVRAYQIARGDWRGDPEPLLPPELAAYLLRYQEGIEWAGKLPPSEIWSSLSRREAAAGPPVRFADDARHRYTRWSILASSLYCPVVYLPSAIGIAMARAAGLGPAGWFYAARVANVLAFALAVWLAVRLARGSRAAIAALALMPMTLHQAGGVSADLMTIAVSIAGFGLILRARGGKPDARVLVAIAALYPLWALCKTSVWALPLLLFIPAPWFRDRGRRVLFVGGVALASIAALVLWQHVVQGNLALFRADRLARGMDTAANSAFLRSHPLWFGRLLAAHIGDRFGEHAGQFIGAFGWTKLMLPAPWRVFYFGLLLAAAVFEAPGRRVSVAERAGFGALFVATAAATYVVLFASDGVVTPQGIGFPYSAGVQGRYFIPFALAGLLALQQNRRHLPPRTLVGVVVCLGAAFDLFILMLLRGHYYA